MTKHFGPDTPGLYDFDLATLAQAAKLAEANDPSVRAELVAPYAEHNTVPGADWAIVTGIAAGNTAELVRIIGRLTDELGKRDARIEDLRGQLRDKATEAGGLRASLRLAQAGSAR